MFDTSLYIYICVKHFGMTNIKFVASQAKTISLCKSTRSKQLKYCANIYLIKQCLVKKVIPIYANLKLTNNSPVSQFTTKNNPNTTINIIKFCCVWLTHHCIFMYGCRTLRDGKRSIYDYWSTACIKRRQNVQRHLLESRNLCLCLLICSLFKDALSKIYSREFWYVIKSMGTRNKIIFGG